MKINNVENSYLCWNQISHYLFLATFSVGTHMVDLNIIEYIMDFQLVAPISIPLIKLLLLRI